MQQKHDKLKKKSFYVKRQPKTELHAGALAALQADDDLDKDGDNNSTTCGEILQTPLSIQSPMKRSTSLFNTIFQKKELPKKLSVDQLQSIFRRLDINHDGVWHFITHTLFSN